MKKVILLVLCSMLLSSCAISQNNQDQSGIAPEGAPADITLSANSGEPSGSAGEAAVYGKERFFSRPAGSRSVWVWGNAYKMLQDASKKRDFLDFLKKPHDISEPITNVYLDCSRTYLINDNYKKKLADFITAAHEQGVCVQFLAGDPAWAYQNRTVISIIEAMAKYNAEVPPQARFDGIHFDIEPHTMPIWGRDDRLRSRFLTSAQLYGEKMREHSPDIVFGLDLPIFWNEDEIRIFAQATDYITLMNYTDNPVSMANRAEKFLKVAEELGKKVESGIETQEPSVKWGVTPPITFYDEGYEIMESALAKAGEIMGRSPAFIGFAIHYDESYRNMSKERVILRDNRVYPEQPVISIPQSKAPIVIDGNLDDWQEAGVVEIKNKKHVVYEITPGKWEGNHDLSCNSYLLWDSEALYIGFDVTDDVIFQKHTGSQMVTGDHLELWFDTDYHGDEETSYPSDDDFQIGISPGNFDTVDPSMTIWLPGDSKEFDLSLITYAVAKSDTGYRIEMKIPFSFFKIGAPSAGGYMRINIDPSDTDGPVDDQEILMSSSISREYGNPRTFRLVIFE
ncbi:MAG: sugar-binding protein [Candidatus Auribacterota bacterium]|jgi:hypothetical protein|nr:sugar-binding protein [Candidatus Auribacterota bacterium]